MVFDTQEQKDRVIKLVGEAPIQTNIAGLMSGPSEELRDLMNALQIAEIASPELLQLLALKQKLDEDKTTAVE